MMGLTCAPYFRRTFHYVCRGCMALLLALALKTHAQGWDHDKALAPSVIIDFGAPHAWTMEQAHYLLERNRAHDLGIAEKDPGQLDPNDTVGFRVQALSTLLSASVQFDQSIGAKNRAGLQAFQAQLAQYNSAITQRAAVSAQLAQISANLQTANEALTTLQAASTPDTVAITQQQAIISGLTAQSTALNSEVTALNTTLASAPTLPSLAGAEPSADETTQSALVDNPLFDNAVKAFNPGTGGSRLSAEQQLDNYINFQYEMVAKQLTLLRDDVGPNSRVLFLELPHSLYVTDKLHLYPYFGGLWGSHLVQSWWTVGGALLSRPLDDRALEYGAHRPPSMLETRELMNRFPRFQSAGLIFINSLRPTDLPPGCAAEHAPVTNALSLPTHPLTEPQRKMCQREANANSDQIRARSTGANSERALNTFFLHSGQALATIIRSPDFAAKFFNLPDPTQGNEAILGTEDEKYFQNWATYWQYASIGLEQGAPGSQTAPIFALDLIPRQSALNVAGSTTSTHQYGFAGVFGWLSGLGARARYERQKQEYSQFTQVENYATAFGKGDYTFGWTFAPNPGTKEIAAGLRTTYAVLVVPKDTRVVRLNAMGCGGRRREVPRNPFAVDANQVSIMPDSVDASFQFMTGATRQNKLDSEDCGMLHTFDIEVPSGDDDFWIDDALYDSVPAGQRATVRIKGRFGDQTGVLVNGTPLQKVPSVAQPMLTPSGYTVGPNAGDPMTQGVFEIVHTRERQDELGSDLVLTFTMPPTFTGTPKILIVSASRDKLVNDVRHRVGTDERTLIGDVDKPPMFYAPPAITRVDVTYPSATSALVRIVGRGFTEAVDSSLVIGTIALGPRANKLVPPVADHEFKVFDGGTVMSATVNRTNLPAQWSIDYISSVYQQVVDVTSTHDDTSGPANITSCKYTLGAAKDSVTPVQVTMTGKFFYPVNTPGLAVDGDSKKATGITSQLTGDSQWQIGADVPSDAKTFSVTIKPSIAVNAQSSPCTNKTPPAKAPLHKKAPTPAHKSKQ